MNNDYEWDELIDRHLRDDLSEAEKERLADTLDSDPSARRSFVDQVRWNARLAGLLRERRWVGDSFGKRVGANVPSRPVIESVTLRRFSGSVVAGAAVIGAAVIIVALSFSEFMPGKVAEVSVARITGMSGSLLWTGDGGRVVNNLAVGQKLSGGTIEGTGPHSWAELKFKDGSTFRVLGNSLLTFSDYGQKELRLRQGNFSASVVPQPEGKPMLVHTRSVTLEVLGTKFEVEAELSSTALNVSEGKVRLTRLSDGDMIDVPANNRVIAEADRELSLTKLTSTVYGWQSNLHSGPEGAYGKWLPETQTAPAALKAIPYTTEQEKTIYAASLGLSSQNDSSIVLQPDTQIRVRGNIESSHEVYFGMTLKQAGGDFAGRFQVIRPAAEFPDGQEFEVVLDLTAYQLDPSLKHMRDKLPTNLSNLIVDSVWVHTLYDPVGLAITEVELKRSNND